MLADGRSAELLNRIADAIGIDVGAFKASREEAGPDTADVRSAEHEDVVLLYRLATAFRLLPTVEARLQALHLVEALAVRAKEGAQPLQVETTGQDGGS